MPTVPPVSSAGPEHVLPFLEVLRQCASQPLETAIVSGDERLTYGELGDASARLARRLVHLGVGPGVAVGVCLASGRPEQLLAMLAIFRIGAVYVPLDPTHPADLIAYEIEETKPRVVITDVTSAQHLDSKRTVLVDIDSMGQQPSEREAPRSSRKGASNDPIDLDSVAVILFTSGTTGRPKGVQLTHRSLAQFVQSARAAYGFSASDAFCSIARYTFSISFFELLSPLTVGGVLYLSRRADVLRPEFLTNLLERVTVLHAGPSLLSRLSRYAQEYREKRPFLHLRHVSTGGDIVLPDVMERMKVLFPRAELFVIYGCTEISCMGTEYRIPLSEKVTTSYVGRPFPGVGVRLLDATGGLAAQGAVGEICFSGAGLAAGYLNRPEVEAEKFVPIEGQRHYRTGDLGRIGEDGQLEFLGRNDFQVQIRGMRVELIGIENMIRELRLADECATALRHFGPDDERLVAFVQHPHASAGEIRRQLAERLPDFTVPSHIVPVEALPLTVNGKLDRRGLQDLPIAQPAAESRPSHGSSQELRIARAFAEVLQVSELGPEDNFFDLGGHSLLAVEAAEQVQNALGMPVSPGDILQASTPRKLLDHLQSERRVHRPIPLNACTAPDRLFLIMGIHYFRELARRLEPHFSVYGVYVERELSFFEGGATVWIPALAARYVEVIRREQPTGPYRVAGHSFGGLTAYEVARQLTAAGETVLQLGMLDTMVADFGWGGHVRRVGRFFRLGAKGQAIWLLQRAQRTLRAMRGLRRAKFGRHEGGRFGEMEVFREDAYLKAEREYLETLAPVRVPTALIVAGKRLEQGPLDAADGGWSVYMEGVERHVVDADHLSMLQEPAVAQVAEILARSGTAVST